MLTGGEKKREQKMVKAAESDSQESLTVISLRAKQHNPIITEPQKQTGGDKGMIYLSKNSFCQL